MTKIEKKSSIVIDRSSQIIGINLQNMREEAGLSRHYVSETLNVSVQQLQKYETGKNRLPIDRMYILKNIYGVPYERFFENLDLDLSRYGVKPVRRDPLAQEIYHMSSSVGDQRLKLKIRNVVRALVT